MAPLVDDSVLRALGRSGPDVAVVGTGGDASCGRGWKSVGDGRAAERAVEIRGGHGRAFQRLGVSTTMAPLADGSTARISRHRWPMPARRRSVFSHSLGRWYVRPVDASCGRDTTAEAEDVKTWAAEGPLGKPSASETAPAGDKLANSLQLHHLRQRPTQMFRTVALRDDSARLRRSHQRRSSTSLVVL